MSIRKNTAINLAGYVVPMLVTLATVPPYLKVLGDARYGVLALVWLVLGYFSFFEMGLGKSTANHIARLDEASIEARQTVFWTAVGVNAALGCTAAAVLGVLGSFVLTHLLSVPAGFRSEALSALPWMVATLPLAMVSSVLIGALEGRSRFLTVNLLQVVTTVVFQVTPLAVAHMYGPSLASVIPAAVLSRAAMNIPFLVACYRGVPLSHKIRGSKHVARSLLAYGGWVALTGAIGSLLDTIDRMFVGVVLGPAAVTYYTVPTQLVNKARVIPGSLGRALFPRFSADGSAAAERLASTSLLSLLVLMTPLVLAGIVLLDPFMSLWLGRSLADKTAPLGEVMLIGVWAASLAHIPYFLLQGTGRPGVVGRLQLLEMVPFLFVLWAALHLWGLQGAAWIWTVRIVIDAALMFRLAEMPRHLLRTTGIPLLLIVAAVAGASWIGRPRWPLRIGLATTAAVCIVLWLWTTGGFAMFRNLGMRRRVVGRPTPTEVE
jgi:O-antigen/teichoic acid export membrane protein